MRLHINIDHVATVRQARRTDEPDPARAAVLAELGGADGITVHLREDRRHIVDRDVRILMETVRTGVNLEISSEPAMVEIGVHTRPMAITLVPERREEITTEGGLALGDKLRFGRVQEAVAACTAEGIRTALFIDPDLAAVEASADAGAVAIELHTGGWAERWKAMRRPGGADPLTEELARIRRAAARGRALGLDVHAGHGLTYENVAPIAAIAEIEELNIGHSIVSRAVLIGMERAVREMKEAIRRARTGCA